MKNFAHKHGTPNPIMQQEEKSILLSVDRALSSSTNSQTIGRNGELPLIEFLNRYLPLTLKAYSGHFITPDGQLSPQIDIMIVDSRYPLLSHNLDGSVLVMAHSVIQTIEVKTNLNSKDISKIISDSQKITKMISDIEMIGDCGEWGSISTKAIAYKCQQSLKILEKKFKEDTDITKGHLDLTILRYPVKKNNEIEIGGCFHFEPLDDDTDLNDFQDMIDDIKDGYLFLPIDYHTPLSDFYYSLVQESYYTLGERDFGFTDIGIHIMNYMSWSTVKY